MPTKLACPRVLELKQLSGTTSRELLGDATTREQVLAALDVAGAVLLRGWGVGSVAEFGALVSALGLSDCADYFPAEAGREPLSRGAAQAATVWPTNSLRSTGGYLSGEVLPHNENYYALTQPRVVAFWCARPGWLGGETLLVDGSRALAALPPRLAALLARRACVVRRRLTRRQLRARHGITCLRELRSACAQGGARVRLLGKNVVEITFQKPSVVVPRPLRRGGVSGDAKHTPYAAADNGSAGVRQAVLAFRQTGGQAGAGIRQAGGQAGGQAALCINFSECGLEARAALLAGLLCRGLFGGWAWTLHRLVWMLALQSRWVASAVRAIDGCRGWLLHPLQKLRLLWDEHVVAAAVKAGRTSPVSSRASHGWWERGHSLGEKLSPREEQQLAQALAMHAVAFAWRQGDVLFIDNARMLHDGLPGLGPRHLNVALLGEMALPMPHSQHRLCSGAYGHA